MKTATQCVHSGSIKDQTGGINSPIFTSSAFAYLDAPENVYPRYFNTPNQAAVVAKLCALEKAEDGLLFSSGMAAISTAMLAHLRQGDHVVLQRDIYGGTHHWVTAEFDKFGLHYTFASNRTEAMAQALKPNTRMIYIESPSNPLLALTDITAVAHLAQSAGCLSVIDNTFATPILQNPIELGIDIVVHSGTKYLGGHSDICCGVALARKELMAPIRASAVNLGGSLNAMTCYLLERSLKTMALRVERQCRNAADIAAFLASQQRVHKVFYPGLSDHPGHAIARAQMRAFGAMLSFELDERADPLQFLRRLRLITPAVSLGGVETTICAPAQTSHVKLSAFDRTAMGVSDSLLRLSVGIEHASDLIDDLKTALKA